MKNWKTTLAGILAGIAAACLESHDEHVQTFGKFALPIALYLQGHVAADHTVNKDRQLPLLQILAPVLVLTAALGSGCSTTPALVRALAKDPATVSARVVTPWGTQTFTRIGGTTNAVTVTADGAVTINPPK